MDKNQLFNNACKRYSPELKYKKPAAFAVVGNIMRSINSGTNENKIEMLTNSLTSICNSTTISIGGVKRAEVDFIIRAVFMLESGKITNSDLMSIPYEDMYFYFCTIERQSRCSLEVKKYIEADEKSFKELRLKKEKEKEKAELEASIIKQKIEAMKPWEKAVYDIKTAGTNETLPSFIVSTLNEFQGEGKIAVANALKTYYQLLNKWEGKLTEKQKLKVQKVKLTLED